jgi:hypothetical protein
VRPTYLAKKEKATELKITNKRLIIISFLIFQCFSEKAVVKIDELQGGKY